MEEQIKLKCTNGILFVYEDRVVISRNSAAGFIAQGLKGDKVFFYKDLSSIEYRKPTFFANGYIKFIVAGTSETKQNIGILGNTTTSALKDPNTLILRAFNKKVPEESEKIYNYILKKIKEVKQEIKNDKSYSSADEILKFKNLLDEGIITQEEFDKKKKELLNK